MSQPRRRWFISVVLVLAIIAFVGFSMLPLFSTAFRASQPAGEAPVTNQAQQQLTEAARGYEVVLQREPENQTALRGLVKARLELLDLKGAVAPLQKLAALNPTEAEYNLLLADIKQRLGDREGETTAYRSILATNPGNLQALEGLANIQLREQRPTEAIALLQNTLDNAQQADNIDVNAVRLLLAQVYATQQNYNEAIAIYDELISNNKQDFRPVLAKAMALKQQGKNEEAKSLFDNAASLAPAQYKERINQLAQAPQVAPTPSPAN
ncbi:tetratricopeptide repeat-containing protein [Gloeocapsa sp. PCC 7428]|uniref:tetratricopeptide repeat protein n=1 Tax=Gloeocapsa sp. PCC 7428 TaxID=1173026 RepID=UPI0002A60F36|nr:tetratricopeptide repeat protein [Gloeocapsa sp. PCC 7428]AFZ30897.1 tetratricopeptide repeat-containing protein [Gloeocapsa sp. PCC 7428]